MEDLQYEIKNHQKALATNQHLCEELFKDKERIQKSIKKDAPAVYRKYQVDVFSEVSIYKKNALAMMEKSLLVGQ